MSTYAFKGSGYNHAYDAFGFHVERVTLDMAKVLSGETKLVNPATGLDVVPASIESGDIYEIFNVKRGFMIMCAGFIVDDAYAGTEPGNVLSLGDNVDDLIVKNVSGDATADPDFFVDQADLLFGKMYYSGFTGPAACSPVNSGLPSYYMAIGNTSIDLTFESLAETDGALLDEMVLQLFMLGFHTMDGDIDGFEDNLVPFIIP